MQLFKPLAVYTLIALSFFQRPCWCVTSKYHPDCRSLKSTETPDIVVSNIPILPDIYYYPFQICIMIFLMFSKCCKYLSVEKGHWTYQEEIILGTLSLLFVGTVTNAIFLIIDHEFLTVNFDVLIKPLFIIIYQRTFRNMISVFYRCISNAIPILLIWIFNAMFFLCLGRIIWQDMHEDNFFMEFYESIWQIFVISTTNSYPDCQLPFIKIHRFSQIYFSAFLLINTIIIFNVLISVFYSAYKNILKEQNQIFFNLNSAKLQDILDRYLDNHFVKNKEELQINDVKENCHLVKQEVFHEDEEESIPEHNIFYLKEFMHIVNPMNYTGCRKFLVDLIENYLYQLCIGIVALINFTLCLWSTQELNMTRIWIFLVFLCNTVIFGNEIIKLILLGKLYFQQYILQYFEVILCIVIYIFIGYFIYSDSQIITSKTGNVQRGEETARMILEILCLLRVIRAFLVFLTFRTIYILFIGVLHTFQTITNLLFVLLVVGMAFAGVGMYLFGGKIMLGHKYQLTHEGVNEDYVYINFNDMYMSLCLLWDLLMINNLDAIVKSFNRIMGTRIYRIYFFSWYFIANLIIFNIIVAVIIDTIVSKIDAAKAQQTKDLKKQEKKKIQQDIKEKKVIVNW